LGTCLVEVLTVRKIEERSQYDGRSARGRAGKTSSGRKDGAGELAESELPLKD